MNQLNSNSEVFLSIYNELDRYMRRELKSNDEESHTSLIKRMAEKNKIFFRYKEDLISFAKLRNAIVHNPYKKYAEPIAEPHSFIVKEFEQIKNEVINPPIALYTIAIRSESIYTTTVDAVALDVMKEMSKKTYTHVPVIEDRRLIGVFSENSIFSYMVENQDVLVERDAKIREFSEFIPIDKHKSELFMFVPKNTLIIEIEDMFQNQLDEGKRLSAIFITETGKSTERVLGMITAWDVAGYRK